ncbi:MAG: CZB domain-containing protein [Thiohalomonadaceae bacterium]
MASSRIADYETIDFFTAIEAHVRWKIRLEAYIAGTSEEKLDPDTVARDDQCALGKWIHSSGGARFGSHPKFPELRDIHAQFHRCAGEVIRAIDRGEIDTARESLAKGEYARYSQRIKAELARLALELDDWEKTGA